MSVSYRNKNYVELKKNNQADPQGFPARGGSCHSRVRNTGAAGSSGAGAGTGAGGGGRNRSPGDVHCSGRPITSRLAAHLSAWFPDA